MSSIPFHDESVAALVTHFQAATGASDDQIAAAIGYESGRVITMITGGRMKLPVNKVQALAKAIGVDAVRVLRAVLADGSPGLLGVLEEIFPAMKFDAADVKLLTTLRDMRGDRKWAPIVFNGQAVVALVAV